MSEDNTKVLIQELLLSQDNMKEENTSEMFCRGENYSAASGKDPFFIPAGTCVDFFTYFNALSVSKWSKYTSLEDYALELEAEGSFEIELFGCYSGEKIIDEKTKEEKKKTVRESFGITAFDLKEKTLIALPFPKEHKSSIVAFQIKAGTDSRFFGGCYTAKTDKNKIREPKITLITTTFKKESYIKTNIQLLNSSIFKNKELSSHFSWKIIDNGRTLEPESLNNSHITIVPNKNVGGSGGFARGMIEVLKEKEKPTHVLLMDDDVIMIPESFLRLYRILKYLKPEYDDRFISGAMLEISERNIQHEDVGIFMKHGGHGPAKGRLDLNEIDSVLSNEEEDRISDEKEHYYSGWWYCCIPMTVVRPDNLPLPFFVRGDDVEYSLRNRAKFITLNGICIWHEGFGAKFSCQMEFYQVHRNDLILQAMLPDLADIQVIQRVDNLFWEELLKFNYKACSLLLDSVEDFLKGPDYLKQLDGEACMQEKRRADNQLVPFTDEVRNLLEESIREEGPLEKVVYLTGLKRQIYGHSANGQKFLGGHRTVVIPYGWGYSQKRLYKAEHVIAVDTGRELYVKFTREKNQYEELIKRQKALSERFRTKHKEVVNAYREQEAELRSLEFWTEYLK